MQTQGLLAGFTLLTCLGAGILLFQGVQAVRYRSERLNAAAGVAALVAVLAGMVCFAMKLGHWERLFGGFSNLTSGITLQLYAVVVFVAVGVVFVAASARSEDGNVPRWCGVAAIAASLALVVCATFGYELRVDFGSEFFALVACFLTSALTLGCFAEMVLAAVLDDGDAMRLARTCAAGTVALAALGMVVYLVWFSLDTQAAVTAGKSMFSMDTFTVGGAVDSATSADKLALALTGTYASLFWGGCVAVGVAAPAASGVAALALAKKSRWVLAGLGAAGLACSLVGGVCFRMVIQLIA